MAGRVRAGDWSARLGATLGMLAASACGSTPPPCDCLYEGFVSHCLLTEGCADDADCPTGAFCAHPGGDMGSACRARSFSELVESNSLAANFNVPTFDLTPVASTTAAVFHWMAPDNSRRVICAYFNCPPVFRAEQSSSIFDLVIDQIANFDECVLYSQQFDISEGIFDVGASLPHIYGTKMSLSCPAHTYQKFTTSMVGCWAYDETKVIAASTLQPVAASEVDHRGPLDVNCENDQSTGLSCLLAPSSSVFGVCAAGPGESAPSCHARCVIDDDCAVVIRVPSDGGDDDGGVPAMTCLHYDGDAGGVVGVCVPAVP